MHNESAEISGRDLYIKDMSMLVACDRVEGSRVFGSDGKQIGHIERLMLEKSDGRIAFVILSFGGFFGIGQEHYRLPWEKLRYDARIDGYRVSMTKNDIEKACRFAAKDDHDHKNHGHKSHDYFGVPPYWM
ncbi:MULTISPECIES: PRC-barrel domain-containing protein [unclassified Rhizobium]|uniref:PRC-barrel domain-containing protein n=1 Tax=unclassified Rhizobium TaxID=2613769 RepID=UPI000EAAAB1E|nr:MULTISPECIES: PRC-barrel domain-containing protein [unclassified Rhizobium]AYG65104.1 PRC-barrel domain containing protein [Rhizobium sp. CCGE531]AYG71588.1 PRC-barrel domain containing protein [Rhizobium sp. CCGE532]